MDEREGILEREITEGGGKAKAGKTILCGAAVLALLAGGGLFAFHCIRQPGGYQEYAVHMEQYFVEYSDEYDYWDVLTVEYPRLEGIDENVQEPLNQLMYDTAMDRVNYWHLFPNEEVKEFQEEHYSIFCSDVSCEVTFHSQYLVSMDFLELYSAGNPVWMTNGTERALTVDLVTGESYELGDILEINEDLIREWDKAYCEEAGVETSDDETRDLLLECFLCQEDEDFLYRPFFYVVENGDLVVGISLDPVLGEAVTYTPVSRNISACMAESVLEPYKKESGFWERLEDSRPAGEVFPCLDKKKNIWLGEDAGIWKER